MADPVNNIKTAVSCMQEIAKLLPYGANLEAHLLEQPESSLELVLHLAAKLKLVPEHRQGVSVQELATYFGAPVLLRLKNGNWVISLGTRRNEKAGEERFAIFDPLLTTAGKQIMPNGEELARSWQGDAVFLGNINNPNFSADGRHTALYSLVAIAKNSGVPADVNLLLHTYAISESEPTRRLLKKMADDLEFSARTSKLKWADLPKLSPQVYPFMAFRQDGTATVFCGLRPAVEPDGEGKGGRPEELAVWDPVPPEGKPVEISFIQESQFEEEYTGEIMFFKRRYSLTEEEQPFRLRWFIPEFIRQKKLMAQVAIAVIAVSLIGLAIPLFFQLVVDKVLLHRSYLTLTVLGIGVMVMLFFNAILEFLQNYFLIFATNRIDIRLATKTFSRLLSLPVDFYERISSGVLIKHMQQTEKIRGFLSGSLFFSLLELISLFVFLPFLIFYSGTLTLIVIAFTLAIAAVIAALIKPFQRRLEDLYMAEGKRQGMLVETINGIRTVKSLALEPAQLRKWNDTAAYAVSRYFRVAKISMTARTISQFLEKSMFVTIIWVGAYAVFEHKLSVGALIAFQMLAGRVTTPLVRIVGLVHEYQQTALSVKMLGVVMNAQQERVGGSIRHRLRGEVSLENVTFQYTPDGPKVVDDVSIHIPPGTTVGLVGRSGSGKTTVTKLMQGLYPLQGGIIKYDGIDIREIDRAALRSGIGVVLQDNYFFYGTIRENLSLTKRDAPMEEIIYAARMAGADEFIQTLPRGYDSMLEENASNLSGGQRQRLAIARALLSNPRLLIFDEATSALDPESETLIRRNLKMITRNRSVLIISHRLSVLCRADLIVVMDKGKIVERGTHQELMAHGGIYAEFWRQQMGVDQDV